MRGWLGCVVITAVMACYSPTARPGVPCTLELDNCPSGQTCTSVGGESVCVEDGAPVDASVDDGPPIDMPVTPDALVDASPDAALARWTLVHHAGAELDKVVVPATTAGNLVIVAIETAGATPVTAITDNVNNTYVRATGSRAVHVVRDFAVEVWYAVNAKAGATQITATAGTVFGLVVWEVAGITSPTPLGNVAVLDNRATTSTPSGAPITTTTTGEMVVSVVLVADVVNAIVPGAFTNDESVKSNGWAHLTSNTAPPGTYVVSYSSTAGVYCATSVAFRVN